MNAIVDKLLAYAQIHLDLRAEDVVYFRNRMLETLKLNNYEPQQVDLDAIRRMSVPDALISELCEYIAAQHLAQGGEIERLAGSIIGSLTPLPSVVNDRFKTLYAINPHQATDYLYNLQIKNDYIKKTFVDTNIHWIANFHDNFLEITINMSKPEKRNEDIAKLVAAMPSGYPKCVLCEDNVGYYGHSSHPNRTNLRTVDLDLDNEPWFFQYSPYVYYDRHCIVIDKDHRPMEISDRNLRKLLAFIDQFPHFFIGSNSDLPIVGGSILNHEHFQGGAHLMPLMYARVNEEVPLPKFAGVSCHTLKWYNTAFLFQSNDKEALIAAINHMYGCWKDYSDESVGVISKTTTRHNTATILARLSEGQYLVYVILRNNRADKTYPGGIFHAHPEYYHIKSEGIGLIEASGLFILPSRLKRQLATIEECLKDRLTPETLIKQNPDLDIHKTMIEHLCALPETDVKKQIVTYVNNVCRSILMNTAVFKNDDQGIKAWQRFNKEFSR